MKRLVYLLCAILTLVSGTGATAFATAGTDDVYNSSNGILFYDRNEGICGDISEATSGDLSTSSGYDRLKDATRKYGETAMQMQRVYGTPWEVVFAQMQKESGVGVAGIAVTGATNNWLGISGTGDAGTYLSPSGRKWAKYTSVSASIEDWAGPRVLRNGFYDDAFVYLSPNSYDLDNFLRKMLAHYAPSSDGNNEEAYRQDLLSLINGPIAEVRAEKGWPSSQELAQRENIPIGGQNAIGSDVSKDSEATYNCDTNGDINATAILLSWSDRTHASNDPNTSYKTALNAEDGVATRGEGDSCSMGGNSCDAFVATVMRFSGADKDFPCCGAANQLAYLASHGEKYQEIPNTGNAAGLQPGDIRSRPGHIEMYVVLEDGSGRIASASHCDRTADHAINFYADSSYRIFRRVDHGV
jgi:hypothetical protein